MTALVAYERVGPARAKEHSIDRGVDAEVEAALRREVTAALSLIGVDQGDTTGDAFRARGPR